MNHDDYTDQYIHDILRTISSIAMIGASRNPARDSHHVFEYLLQRGYDVTPINPGQVGHDLCGKPFVASLDKIGHPIDMVDIFRSAANIMPVIDDVLAMTPLPKVVWMQLGVRNDVAAAKAEAAGIKVVMNRCPLIEYERLSHPERRPDPGH